MKDGTGRQTTGTVLSADEDCFFSHLKTKSAVLRCLMDEALFENEANVMTDLLLWRKIKPTLCTHYVCMHTENNL